MHPAKGRGSGEEGIILTARDRAEQRVLEEEQPFTARLVSACSSHLEARPRGGGLAAAGRHQWVCSRLGPCTQNLMKDRRNRESLAPPLQGDGVPEKFCFGDKILDKERLGSQSCGLG